MEHLPNNLSKVANKMSISKLISDMAATSQGTPLAEISDCIITLLVTRDKINRYILEQGRGPLAKDYAEAVNDLTVAASSAILGTGRPTEEEMKRLCADRIPRITPAL